MGLISFILGSNQTGGDFLSLIDKVRKTAEEKEELISMLQSENAGLQSQVSQLEKYVSTLSDKIEQLEMGE